MEELTISKALYRATLAYPYYARGFAALTPVERDSMPDDTVGVDKYWRLYYSKKSLEKYKLNIVGLMCHELEHLLREHNSRQKYRNNHERWNMACDLEINDDIEDLPPDGCFVDKFDLEEGKIAEYYYDALPQGDSGKGDGQDFVCEGSGVSTNPAEWEIGESDEVPYVSESEQPALLDNIASDIINEAKQQGSIPDGVLVWAKARAKGKLPKISWKKYIMQRAGRIIKGKTDYTYKRLSRRQNRRDTLILPGTQAYDPKLTLVVDTSGSMAEYADWLAGILKDVHSLYSNVRVIDCDAQIYQRLKLKNWKDILKLRGGGGTDMTIGITEAQKIKSDLIMVLTDGYTPWPKVWPKNLVALVYDGKRTKMKVALNG